MSQSVSPSPTMPMTWDEIVPVAEFSVESVVGQVPGEVGDVAAHHHEPETPVRGSREHRGFAVETNAAFPPETRRTTSRKYPIAEGSMRAPAHSTRCISVCWTDAA